MKLIKTIRGLKISFGGTGNVGWLPPNARPPREEEAVVNLEIVEAKDGFFLVSESSHPHFPGRDTWHQTLEDALLQAEHQFGVKPSDWES